MLTIIQEQFIDISVFNYENKEKYPVYMSKQCCEENHVDLLLIGKREKSTMFLPMNSIDSCMIIHYIGEENIFVVILYVPSI